MKSLRFSVVSRMRESSLGRWYAGRSNSDQRILLVMTGLILATSCYAGVWQPLADFSERSRLEHARAQGMADWIALNESALAQAQSRLTQGSTDAAPTVTRSARQAGITLSRLQPESSGGVSVSIENEPFEAVVEWIARLEADQGLIVERITVDRSEQPGRVDVQLRAR